MAIGTTMCTFHKRSKGGSSIRQVAYNSRSKIYDDRLGVYFDFTNVKNRTDEISMGSHMILPDFVDKRYEDPKLFWNMAEKHEKRPDTNWPEFVVCLPNEDVDLNGKEIDFEWKKAAVEAFVKKEFAKKGIASHIAFHKKEGNHHAHILFYTRPFTAKNTLAKAKDRNISQSAHNKTFWAMRANTFIFDFLEQNHGVAIERDFGKASIQKKEDLF